MVRTAIQLYTLRNVNEPVPEVVARVGETSFDGVELYDEDQEMLAFVPYSNLEALLTEAAYERDAPDVM